MKLCTFRIVGKEYKFQACIFYSLWFYKDYLQKIATKNAHTHKLHAHKKNNCMTYEQKPVFSLRWKMLNMQVEIMEWKKKLVVQANVKSYKMVANQKPKWDAPENEKMSKEGNVQHTAPTASYAKRLCVSMLFTIQNILWIPHFDLHSALQKRASKRDKA